MSRTQLLMSRRTFVFSTAAAIASCVFQQVDEPLHVSIIGFGRHARRLLDRVTNYLVHVDSVFDPSPVALRSASALFKQRQRYAPELFRAASPSLIAYSTAPVLLCSPPHTWPGLIPRLTTHGRPVLAYHSQAFAPPFWPEGLHLLSRQSANLLLIGFDPGFPLDAVRAFHNFARGRGALNSSYSLWHPAWSSAQLLAFHFDCLNAALPQYVSSEEHHDQWQFLPMTVDPGTRMLGASFSTSALCTISAAGPGVSFGAHLGIAEEAADVPSGPEHIVQFATFCRGPQSVRDCILQRQSTLLKLVDASTQAMSLFS